VKGKHMGAQDRGDKFAPDSKLYRSPQAFFRGSLGRFATGVAVVTFQGDTGRHGITINSFTSVSMEPPLVLISIGHTAKSHDMLFDRPFSVNILGAEQEDVGWNFAGRPNDSAEWVDGTVAPRLSGTISWFECTPFANYPGGDHTLFLGEVVNFDYRKGDYLGFIAGKFVPIPDPDPWVELI
jgi:flavin reductase (DIM6/NTAB) family NADH-FMN oxidoreductase RutF